MSAISSCFERLRERGEKALITFVTAGDPDLSQLPEILTALDEAGSDLIEVGIPFSDPIADGPVIQASSQRALDRGVTPQQVLDTLAKVKNLKAPLVLMGYYNPVLRLTLDGFAKSAAKSGVAGTIISDLTPEEADPWMEASRAHGLDNIFLLAPTSTEDRLVEISRRASGFVYAVSRTGVTGSESTAPPEVKSLVQKIKKHTPLPVAVGFGISEPDHVRMVCEVADGAVVGSWLVKLLAAEWKEGNGRQLVIDKVASLKAATRP